MTEKEQTQQFEKELQFLIERMRNEYHITYGTMIGVMEILKTALVIEAIKNNGH